MNLWKGILFFVLLNNQSYAVALSNGGGNEPQGKAELDCVEYVSSELGKLGVPITKLTNKQYSAIANKLVPAFMTEQEFKRCIQRVRLTEVKSAK